MDSKGKSAEVEAITTPSQKDKKRKVEAISKRKESDRNELTALNEKIDKIGNCLIDLTQSVKKLHNISASKEKESPKAKKEEESVCLFEDNGSDMKHRKTIFVKGFNCSFPMDVIKTTLINHFSSCGKVTSVFIPYQCQTRSPLGFAFINMNEYPEKALALDRSNLGGMLLEVAMARERDEFYGYRNRRGCERCGTNLVKRRIRRFYERSRMRIILPPGTIAVPTQNEEANS